MSCSYTVGHLWAHRAESVIFFFLRDKMVEPVGGGSGNGDFQSNSVTKNLQGFNINIRAKFNFLGLQVLD